MYGTPELARAEPDDTTKRYTDTQSRLTRLLIIDKKVVSKTLKSGTGQYLSKECQLEFPEQYLQGMSSVRIPWTISLRNVEC